MAITKVHPLLRTIIFRNYLPKISPINPLCGCGKYFFNSHSCLFNSYTLRSTLFLIRIILHKIICMALKGEVIHNNKTGQTLEFITTSKDSNGKVLKMISAYRAHSKEPPPHYHPMQDEQFVILEGEMCLRMNGRVSTIRQGD